MSVPQAIWNGLQVILLVSSYNLYIPYSDWLPWVWKECHVTPGCATPVVSLRGTHVCTPHKSAPPNCAQKKRAQSHNMHIEQALHDSHMTLHSTVGVAIDEYNAYYKWLLCLRIRQTIYCVYNCKLVHSSDTIYICVYNWFIPQPITCACTYGTWKDKHRNYVM